MGKPTNEDDFDFLLSSAKAEEETRKISKTDYDEEERKENIAKLHVANKLVNENIEDIQQNRIERKQYARWIFRFLVWYMAFVGFVLVLSGITVNHFFLSENVLLMLLGTTTANVIGIFIVVAKYLFPSK